MLAVLFVVLSWGVAQLVVVPLAMGRGTESPGFDSHRGLIFSEGERRRVDWPEPAPRGSWIHRRVMASGLIDSVG